MDQLVLVKGQWMAVHAGPNLLLGRTVRLGQARFSDLGMGLGLHDTATVTGDHGITGHHNVQGLGPLGGTRLKTCLWTGLGVKMSLAPQLDRSSAERWLRPDSQGFSPASSSGSQGHLFPSVPSDINQFQFMDILAMINVTMGPSSKSGPQQGISVEEPKVLHQPILGRLIGCLVVLSSSFSHRLWHRHLPLFPWRNEPRSPSLWTSPSSPSHTLRCLSGWDHQRVCRDRTGLCTVPGQSFRWRVRGRGQHYRPAASQWRKEADSAQSGSSKRQWRYDGRGASGKICSAVSEPPGPRCNTKTILYIYVWRFPC